MDSSIASVPPPTDTHRARCAHRNKMRSRLSWSQPEEEPINIRLYDDGEWHTTPGMPQKFAYSILTASGEEFKNAPWERAAEALQEWNLIYIGYGEGGTCICSHPITDRYYIKHSKTGEVAVVGCDCVQKLDIGNLNLWSQIKLADGMRQLRPNIACASCLMFKVKVDKAEAMPFCKSCKTKKRISSSKNYIAVMGIPCSRCKTAKVLPSHSGYWCQDCAQKCKQCSKSHPDYSDMSTDVRSALVGFARIGHLSTCSVWRVRMRSETRTDE